MKMTTFEKFVWENQISWIFMFLDIVYMKKILFPILLLVVLTGCGHRKCADGTYTLHLYTTNDVHGRYFDSLYVSESYTKESLFAVNHYVDSVRNVIGEENVLLVDAGDCLQGDNAAYYFNYVDTTSKHLYARMTEYMKYDAIALGNHDIETGHPVYDRVVREMKVPFLAANALRTDNGKPYFREFVTVKRHGLNVTIIGFTNPNIKSWLAPAIWEGMEFESLVPFVQQTVDRIKEQEKSDITIVLTHSGTGKGDGRQYENQGLDLFNSLKGVDFLVCSHDHRPYVSARKDMALINSGSHCRNIGRGILTVKVEDGNIVSRELTADYVPVNKHLVDTVMRKHFQKDYNAVKSFTLEKVGSLDTDMRTRDSYQGMCDYMNLIHTISLSCTPADISFAAPLTFNGFVHSGTLLYNDLFTIYPFENQLFVVKMTGREIKDYLEYSYDAWINTVRSAGEHVLKIQKKADPRTGQVGWSFENRAYNFDSAGGLVYTVDVTKPMGKRVSVKRMANGSAFDMKATYNVAMTSYRASGGGKIMEEGAGIDTDKIGERVVAYHKEIRNILYDYIMEHQVLSAKELADPSVIGKWEFVPEDIATVGIARDMGLLFPPRK